jgi:hypothetical protein
MKACLVLALSAALSVSAVDSASADVQLSIQEGRVTLKATDATVREILAAWARVGQTRIVNAERVGGGPANLEFQGIPEEQALEIILRSVSGYLAAPRTNAVEGASRYDRIFVMPTSTPPRTTATTPPPVFPRPTFTPPPQPAPAFDDDDEDDQTPDPTQPQRGPLFTFPAGSIPPEADPPPVSPPPARSGPLPMRGAVGVAVPGMVAEPPPAPPNTQPQP